MASTVAPIIGSEPPKNVVKDAMFLFELFRESPQPILVRSPLFLLPGPLSSSHCFDVFNLTYARNLDPLADSLTPDC